MLCYICCVYCVCTMHVRSIVIGSSFMCFFDLTDDIFFHYLFLLPLNYCHYHYYFVHMFEGNSVELRYALESHGISMNQMPITWTGNIKEQYFKQWIRLRQILEDGDHNSCQDNSDHNGIIVCPRLNDVIFRQGTSAMHHPGNVLFRSRIQHLYENAKAHTMGQSTRILVQKLIQEIQNNEGRVLIWYQSKKCSNSNDCWWTELKDEGQIYTKIKNLVRELKFSKAKHQAINRGDYQTTISSNDFQSKMSKTLPSQEYMCCTNFRGRKRARDNDNDDQCLCSKIQ